MMVKELIEILKTHDPETDVVVFCETSDIENKPIPKCIFDIIDVSTNNIHPQLNVV